jgi:hypothetical protein
MGQPTKYTAEVLGRILTALAIGNTKKDSALGAGVTYTTMRTWELAYPEFLSAVEQARAQARQRMVGVLVTAASRGSWQAALAFLERTDPELWARRDRIDMAIDLRREVKQMAAENGLDEKQVMAEVQSLLASHTPEERPE